MSNIPPPPKSDTKKFPNYPPPPPPMSAEELALRYPKATFVVNNKIVSNKKALNFIKKNKDIRMSTSEKNGKKIIAYNSIRKEYTNEERQNLIYNKILSGPKITNFNFKYFLDKKPITYTELKKINPNKIKNYSVKTAENNTKLVYIVSKK